jgi:uncharacterized phage protein (TIGR01671 family)
MRELKFRAWDGRKMYNDIGAFGTDAFDREGENIWMWEEPPEQIMQFTGLHDKHGKEIYEGDILKETHGTCARKAPRANAVVVWKDNGWKRDTYNGDCNVFPSIDVREMEVIGNIYESPELLT